MLPSTSCGSFVLYTLCLAFLLASQISRCRCQAVNETGLLSDLWNSLTTVGKTASCPGECVHAITSIFCDNVLEEVSCGESFLRCCVPQQFSHATPVETSPPIAITEPTTESFSVMFNSHNVNTTPYSGQWSTEYPDTVPLNIEEPTTTPVYIDDQSLHYANNNQMVPYSNKTVSEVNSESPVSPCPIECSKPSENSFCVKLIREAYCSNQGEECCLEYESAIDTMTKNLIKLVQQSVALNETKNIGPELTALSTPSTTIAPTLPPLPPCDGTCVVPLFSILCDEIDTNQYCSSGGSCCVNREITTPAPQIEPCGGTCIPVILSGMCNKPYELVLKTIDCGSGTICCADKKSDYGSSSDHFDHNSQQQHNSNPDPVEQNKPTLMYDNKPAFINPQHPIRPLKPNIQMIPSNVANQFQHYPAPTGSNKFAPNSAMQPPMQLINSMQKPKPMMFPNRNKTPLDPMLNIGYHQQQSIQGNAMHPDQGYISPSSKPLLVDPVSNKPIFRLPQPHTENLTPAEDAKQHKPIEQTLGYGSKKDMFACVGSCINPMFKFTCFGANSVYPKFQCSKGQICCSPVAEIEKFESFLQSPASQTSVTYNQPQVLTPTKHHSVAPAPVQVETIPATTIKDTSLDSIPHVCGVKNPKRSGRIVGGSDSYPGEWCWQVALVNQQNKYICGGAIIGKQWVLTAAHCITSLVRKNEPLYVRAGEYDLTISNRLGQTQKVVTTYIHHNHNSQSLDNDIALLKLKSPVELNGNTCFVCLPTRNSKRNPGKRCTVTGYGFERESGPIALRIREAIVPIVDDHECSNRINSVTEKQFILPSNSFCAGGEGGNDACQGDGGSGLVCESEGFYELTGLVSWGFGCGRNGVPGVYVKVSSFVGWINQIVSTNNN